MNEYENLSHTTWDCKYHVVFIPKCRRKTLYQELRRHLGEVFRRLETAAMARTPVLPEATTVGALSALRVGSLQCWRTRAPGGNRQFKGRDERAQGVRRRAKAGCI